jgi:4-aminobutyrate aminotransferase-like enzyme
MMTNPPALTGNMPNAYVPGKGNLNAQDAALVLRRQSAMGPAYRLFYETPVHLVRGDGVWLYDKEGNAYLDTYNNVASVGHCHPHVTAATARQSQVFSSHTRYLHETVLVYAEKLLGYFPQPLSHVMFTCTGSEANDLAMRIAMAHTGQSGFIVTENAYHGVTSAIAAMSPSLGKGVALGQNIRVIKAPDSQRLPGDLATAFAAEVQGAIHDLARHGIGMAAFVVDTIFSSDGVLADPAGFLRPAVEAVRAAGGIFIADEVQPGFGRTGQAMWGFQRHGLIPDMVTLGKPMGNGYPIAGVVVTPDVIAAFASKARYFNTFGGNAVAAATAMAVLEVIENESLQNNAKVVGRAFHDGLQSLAQIYDSIGQIRSAGLFLGVEIVSGGPLNADADKAARVVNRLREQRILISATGPRANVLKIRPPLVFAKDHVELFLDKLELVMKSL